MTQVAAGSEEINERKRGKICLWRGKGLKAREFGGFDVLMLTIHRSALQTQKISQAKMLKPVSMGCILLLALRSDVFRVTNSANISFSMREEVESYERERRNWMLESRQFGGVSFLVLGLVSLTDIIPLCRRPIWSHRNQ